MLNTAYAQWIGMTVQQVSCTPGNEKFVGRVSVVKDVITDEKETVHLHTEDGIWCPARHCEILYGAKVIDG